MDSAPETYRHILRVQYYLNQVMSNLMYRGHVHDQSKLGTPEKKIFDELTGSLAGLTYGSPEYMAVIKNPKYKLGIEHHQQNNDHHPEFHGGKIDDMHLIQLIEMLCDWKAASERHADGDIIKSIEFNQKRFGYSDEVKKILINTAVLLLNWES